MIYDRRATPLHAARAAVGSAWCAALAAVALSVQHPLVLSAVLAAALAAAHLAGVGSSVRRMLRWGLPVALLLALVNSIVSRDGVTVIARGGHVPVLGQLDITLEAVAYGGVLALRGIAIVACFALHSAAVDPDGLLRAFRRLGFRSALTAAVATRMVPVLAHDARRLHDARRARGAEGGATWPVVRAVVGGSLDRALDVAATLEVRGYGVARHPRAGTRAPWSRHDTAFALSALALAGLAVAGVAGLDSFDAYPRTQAPLDAGVLLLAGAVPGVALAPFLARRGLG